MQNMNGKTALGLDNNVGAMVCYLNICLPIGLIYSIIVLATDKTNKLPRFHAFQSLLLTAALFILGMVLGVVFGIASAATKSAALGFGFNGFFAGGRILARAFDNELFGCRQAAGVRRTSRANAARADERRQSSA